MNVSANDDKGMYMIRISSWKMSVPSWILHPWSASLILKAIVVPANASTTFDVNLALSESIPRIPQHDLGLGLLLCCVLSCCLANESISLCIIINSSSSLPALLPPCCHGAPLPFVEYSTRTTNPPELVISSLEVVQPMRPDTHTSQEFTFTAALFLLESTKLQLTSSIVAVRWLAQKLFYQQAIAYHRG